MVLEAKTMKRTIHRKLFAFYLIVMFLLYTGFIMMENNHVNKAELQRVEQPNVWSVGFEVSFSILFLGAIIAVVYIYRTRKDIHLMWNFIVLHIGLFIVIGLVGGIVAYIFSLPIGNVMQILMIPAYFFIALVLYTIYEYIKLKKDHSSS